MESFKECKSAHVHLCRKYSVAETKSKMVPKIAEEGLTLEQELGQEDESPDDKEMDFYTLSDLSHELDEDFDGDQLVDVTEKNKRFLISKCRQSVTSEQRS